MSNFVHILIAEDNDVSRDMMAGILRTQGFKIHGAVDGDSAIKVIQNNDIDMAFVDINMAPTGGFEFVKYLVVKGIDLPVVVVTGDDSSDILMEASALGVAKVIQKPIEPDRLVQTVRHIMKRKGMNPDPLMVQEHDTRYTPEELMNRAIELADKNAKNSKGGPFGAVVADGEGQILGEGVNGRSSRMDPTAHAEVMAIRQAAERLESGDLSECVLYCSSEPTMMGQALIVSVGIKKVYFGLSHEEVKAARSSDEDAVRDELKEKKKTTEYIQLGHDEALAMFKKL